MADGYELTKNDWRYVDAIEEITYTGVNQSTGENDRWQETCCKAHRGDPNAPAFSGLGLDHRSSVWVVFTETMGGRLPEKGGFFTDSDGVIWNILSTRKIVFGSRYLVVATPQPKTA